MKLNDIQYLLSEFNHSKNTKAPFQYSYSSHEKVWWICRFCGHDYLSEIHQRTGKNKSGCPQCSKSKGEALISEFLISNNINFSFQYRIPECRNVYPLPFDFAVFDEKMNVLLLIEYDGKQHFEPVNWFGCTNLESTEVNFLLTKKNDSIKSSFCLAHEYELLRIPYFEINNIQKILTAKLKSLRLVE